MFYTAAFVFITVIWLVVFTLAASHVSMGVASLFLLAGVVQWFCGALFVDAICEIRDVRNKKRSY